MTLDPVFLAPEMVPQFSPKTMLIRSLRDYHSKRERTQQIEVGPSSAGDCTRKVWHLYRQTPVTNESDILASLLGTFIHTGIEAAITSEDPFGDDLLREFEVEHDGLKGHIDLYVFTWEAINDWKTTQKKNLKNFPSQQNLYQIHIYGYLAIKNGKKVKMVALTVIPRDGRLDEIVEYVAPYDESIALEGIAWLKNVEDWANSDRRPPPPERSAKNFCSNYCDFYDESALIGCPGIVGGR